jgi:superoxide dismutase, Cu-Zn family
LAKFLGPVSIALCAASTSCWWYAGSSLPPPHPVTPPPAPAAQVRGPIAPSGATASATLHDSVGRRVGSVMFSETYAGLLVQGWVSDLGLGTHGIHLHTVGKCDGPNFASAGGHFNPEQRAHGFKNQHGHHLGDLPNISTPAAGRLEFEFVIPDVTLRGINPLLDADGASIVVHASADDLLTDPAGNSGARIACGVITP